MRKLIERLTKVAKRAGTVTAPEAPMPEAEVTAELRMLRARVPQLTGTLVASVDGLLIAQDLPESVEPSGMAAVTATGLSLAHRIAQTAHGGAFHEVVIRGVDGYVVSYAAGETASLTVLAGPSVNVGRLHLESRPTARAIAELLADMARTATPGGDPPGLELGTGSPTTGSPTTGPPSTGAPKPGTAKPGAAGKSTAGKPAASKPATGTRGTGTRGSSARGTGTRGSGTRSSTSRSTGTRNTGTRST